MKDSKVLTSRTPTFYQVILLVVFVVFSLWISHADGSEARILSNQQRCSALIEGTDVLPLEKEDAVMLKLDLTVNLPSVLNQSFVEDGEGKSCFLKIARTFDSVLRYFYRKVVRIGTDRQILEKHLRLNNPKQKRSTGIAVAIVMGIVNAIATASTFIYDQFQFQELRERVLELEVSSSEMSHQLSVFGNNANFFI